ncbi:MAG: ankyrin repeat domain-containing protein [Planctomycetes bacterium]|nr:ankyrin repeat domain-containing protein [Planctomycetota bacterium]
MSKRPKREFAVGQRWSFECTVPEFESYFYIRKFNSQPGWKWPWGIGVPYRQGQAPLPKQVTVCSMSLTNATLKAVAASLLEEGLVLEEFERQLKVSDSIIPEHPINVCLAQHVARCRELAESQDRHRHGHQLFRWIDSGNVKSIRNLLAKKPELINRPQDPDSYHPPLHYAAWQGKSDVARLLIELGADLNSPGDDDMRPLHYAVLHSQPEIAELLLAQGADLKVRDRSGLTPLEKAELLHEWDIAKRLKSASKRAPQPSRRAPRKSTPRKRGKHE